jgi:hypothetical protein
VARSTGYDRRRQFERIIGLNCFGDVGQWIALKNEAVAIADRRVKAHPEHPEQPRAVEGQQFAARVIKSARAALRIDPPVQQRAEHRVLHLLDLTDRSLAAPVGRGVEHDDHADGFGDLLQVAIQ